MGEYKVVPLEWKKESVNSYWGFSPIISFYIDGRDLRSSEPYYELTDSDEELDDRFNSLEEAKKFAEEYYEGHVRCVIASITEPLTKTEELAQLKEAISGYIGDPNQWLEKPHKDLMNIAPITLASLGAFEPLWEICDELSREHKQ